MKKIVGFKIALHKRDIVRYLKTNYGITEPTLDMREWIEREITRFPSRVMPAAMYETYTQHSIPHPLRLMLAQQPVTVPSLDASPPSSVELPEHSVQVRDSVQLALWNECVAVSLCVITLGTVDKPEHIYSEELWDACMHASIDEAAHFICGLIKYEAVKEDCETGPRRDLEDIKVIRELVSIFDYSKIHISVNHDGTMQPPFTRFMLVNWIPKKR